MQSALTEACVIKIENFEGPFDLLYHLLEKNKIHIYDIPINDIADQYIDYLMEMKELDLDIASEFLVVAATLLHIKSRMLLPNLSELNEDEKDPREELIIRLLEYKKFKEFAIILKERQADWTKYTYKIPDLIEPEDNIESDITGYGLRKIFKELLMNSIDKVNEKAININKITTHDKVSLKEKIKEILHILSRHTQIIFGDYFKFEKKSKTEIVTGFMGILELAKMKKVSLYQRERLNDIVVKLLKTNKNN